METKADVDEKVDEVRATTIGEAIDMTKEKIAATVEQVKERISDAFS